MLVFFFLNQLRLTEANKPTVVSMLILHINVDTHTYIYSILVSFLDLFH